MGNEASRNELIKTNPQSIVELDGWRLENAELVAKSQPVSIFTAEQVKEASCIEQSLHKLRLLRHPSLLRIHSITNSNTGAQVITESVQPFMQCVHTMFPEEILVGLESIIQGLSFLHGQGCYMHNEIECNTIMVTPSGRWKIGLSKTVMPFPNEKCSNSDYLMFADLLQELEHLVSLNFGSLVEAVKQECLDKEKDIITLLSHSIFENQFLKISHFLDNITLKSTSNKELFFHDLATQLKSLPQKLTASRLTKRLLSRFVLVENAANTYFLPEFLKPGVVIESNLFAQYVLPEILSIFFVPDALIRITLLTLFPIYYQAFSKEELLEILPQIVIGLRDSNDHLLQLSLHCLSLLVSPLGGDVIMGSNRSKLFFLGKPNFALHDSVTTKQNRREEIKQKYDERKKKRLRDKVMTGPHEPLKEPLIGIEDEIEGELSVMTSTLSLDKLDRLQSLSSIQNPSSTIQSPIFEGPREENGLKSLQKSADELNSLDVSILNGRKLMKESLEKQLCDENGIDDWENDDIDLWDDCNWNFVQDSNDSNKGAADVMEPQTFPSDSLQDEVVSSRQQTSKECVQVEPGAVVEIKADDDLPLKHSLKLKPQIKVKVENAQSSSVHYNNCKSKDELLLEEFAEDVDYFAGMEPELLKPITVQLIEEVGAKSNDGGSKFKYMSTEDDLLDDSHWGD